MWLLEASALADLQRLKANQGIEINASLFGDNERGSVLSVAGDTARIKVDGVLTGKRDLFAVLFGGGNGLYSDIESAIKSAESNAAVKNVEFHFDSPGGHVNGLFDCIATMQTMKKPKKAVIVGMCASAAYALAAQCSEIVATSNANQIGSIGVAFEKYVNPERVAVTSTAAPKKRPNLATEEGQAMVREELDEMHELFAESIAIGRKTTVENVNAKFGQGATVLSRKALANGMIDSIGFEKAPSKSKPKSENPMDLNQLKAEHPALYAQVFDAGKQQGFQEATEQATEHLLLGAESGDMETAIAAIKEGKPMTSLLRTTYQAASMRNAALNARSDENPNAGKPADPKQNSEADAFANAWDDSETTIL